MNNHSNYLNSSENLKQSNNPQHDFFLTKDISVHSDIPLRDRIRVMLLRKGMSQNQLADKVGVAIGTMSKIVNGDWAPTSQVKIRISEILECDSLVLFGAKEYWADYSKKMIYPKELKK
jgi:DNA-binding XRE family transcriptional regulator